MAGGATPPPLRPALLRPRPPLPQARLLHGRFVLLAALAAPRLGATTASGHLPADAEWQYVQGPGAALGWRGSGRQWRCVGEAREAPETKGLVFLMNKWVGSLFCIEILHISILLHIIFPMYSHHLQFYFFWGSFFAFFYCFFLPGFFSRKVVPPLSGECSGASGSGFFGGGVLAHPPPAPGGQKWPFSRGIHLGWPGTGSNPRPGWFQKPVLFAFFNLRSTPSAFLTARDTPAAKKTR